MRQQCVLTPKKANGMLCWISRNKAIRLRDLVLSLFSPLMRLHLKYCCPVLGSLVQEGCGCSGCKPIKGSGGGWWLEHTTLEEKLREQDLFRSEAVGNWDLNAVQPLSSVVCGDRMRVQQTQVAAWEIPIIWEEQIFHHECARYWNRGPEKFRNLLSWRYSKLDWTNPSKLIQVGPAGVLGKKPPEVPSNLNHAMMLL